MTSIDVDAVNWRVISRDFTWSSKNWRIFVDVNWRHLTKVDVIFWNDVNLTWKHYSVIFSPFDAFLTLFWRLTLKNAQWRTYYATKNWKIIKFKFLTLVDVKLTLGRKIRITSFDVNFFGWRQLTSQWRDLTWFDVNWRQSKVIFTKMFFYVF